MTIFDLSQTGLTPGSKTVHRPPVNAAVNIEANQQQVPYPGRLPIGASPGSLDRGQWARTGHNYNKTVKQSGPGPTLVNQLGGPGVAAIQHAAPDTTLPTEETSRQWLAEAEEQLDECSGCAVEEKLLPPSGTALTKSRELLQQFSASITSQPDIYPMDEGSVAIDFRTPDGRSGVLFVVDQDGSGAMFYCKKDVRSRTRVDDASQLISEGAITTLRRAGIR